MDKRTLLRLFGRNLKYARGKAGLSQPQLASAANITEGYVSMLERGAKSPSLVTIANLAIALGIQPRQLVPEV